LNLRDAVRGNQRGVKSRGLGIQKKPEPNLTLGLGKERGENSKGKRKSERPPEKLLNVDQETRPGEPDTLTTALSSHPV